MAVRSEIMIEVLGSIHTNMVTSLRRKQMKKLTLKAELCYFALHLSEL